MDRDIRLVDIYTSDHESKAEDMESSEPCHCGCDCDACAYCYYGNEDVDMNNWKD